MTHLALTDADARIPATHPFRRHLDEVIEREAIDPHRRWTPADGRMPAIYLSHGSPMTFEDSAWMRELYAWARSMPKPASVLIVSAHWEDAPVVITGAEPAELVYDFGGFAPLYNDMRYDTPPAVDLAERVMGTIHTTPTGRGLDHGAWVPLKIMYPFADVPVVQMSLPTDDPAALLALGERLRPRRDEGTLVIGSGFMTHGLPFLTRAEFAGAIPQWSAEFDHWAASALERGDVDELMNYASRAPGLPYAHPTVEHLTPLFVTLGAATDPSAPVTTAIDGFTIGLSKRSVQAA